MRFNQQKQYIFWEEASLKFQLIQTSVSQECQFSLVRLIDWLKNKITFATFHNDAKF